jgi:hypothetical protein
MQKRGTLFIIYLTCFMVMLLITVSARIDDTISIFYIDREPICYDNGQIEFTLGTTKSKVYIEEMIVGIGYKIRASDDYTKVKGAWYSEQYKKQNIFSEDDKIIFISDEYMFNSNTEYTITLSPRPIEITDFYKSMMTLKIPVKCQGYNHSCRFINLSIDECYKKGEVLHVFFHGIGENNYSEVDLVNDIDVFINYQTKNAEMTTPYISPEKRKYQGYGDDNFELIIPLSNKTRYITSIALKVKGCNEHLYNIFDYSSCGVVVDTEIKNKELTIEYNDNKTEIVPSNNTEVQPDLINETGSKLPDYNIDDFFSFKVIRFILDMLPLHR